MAKKNRAFSLEFKESVAQRILNGESVSALHQELQIKRSILYRWRDAYQKEGAAGLQRRVGRPPGGQNPPRFYRQPGGCRRPAHPGVGAEDLLAGHGNRFFAKSLQACKGIAPEEHRRWRDSIYTEIRSMMQLEGFRAEHACEVARVSRAGFYREYAEHEPRQADVDLRDAIQRIALANRYYGYRRVTAELKYQGVVVNHKRVLRLMRADNLLAVRKRRFIFTTDSSHTYAIYPNLAARFTITGINQLWVADITYVRLRETFLYVAIVLDAFSRRVVGWELGEDLRAELALRALDRALAGRQIEAGIVHHSDRGVQYCCTAYVEKLQAHGFIISMSRTGNPYDNAKAESFMKTLKTEEVYLKQYRDQEDARASIQRFIEEVYNRKRLHSSLGYRSPDVFEQQQDEGAAQ